MLSHIRIQSETPTINTLEEFWISFSVISLLSSRPADGWTPAMLRKTASSAMRQFLPHLRGTRSIALPQISPRHLNHSPLFSPTAITAISNTQVPHLSKAFFSTTSRWEKQKAPQRSKPSSMAREKVAAEARRVL